MIAALNSDRFNYELKLKEYGVPKYILDEKDEPGLRRMIELIPKNPWMFYDKDLGFSIKLCERLAEHFRIDNSYEKCKAYLQYAIDCAAGQGHCYAREWQIEHIIKECRFSDYDKQKAIDFLTQTNVLFVSDKKNYFLSKYFNAEKSFANMVTYQASMNGGETGFCKYEDYLYDNLTDAQKTAVDAIENNSLIILTGLPGTGKTTTMRAIVSCYGADNVLLFAPTGKAATRLGELCGLNASTLHSFFLNCNNIIDNKIVIIDEASMMDAEIAGYVGNGIKNNCVLLLVGDPDQLPSVGPGEILFSVLASGLGCRIHLTQIMRQKAGSLLKSAHSIHAGNNIITDNDNEVITYYPKEWNIEAITSKLMANSEWRDAQILSVLKEKCSTIVNKVVQNTFFPNHSHHFNVNDKVIHIKNNKELNVFNGEMGVVVRKTDRITYVEYKDKIVEYPNSLLWQLELSYCITVHKSQGSEFDKVIFFVNQSRITSRNLLYTGLTRAKKRILLIAPNEQTIINAISNIPKRRQTSLPWLLKR